MGQRGCYYNKALIFGLVPSPVIFVVIMEINCTEKELFLLKKVANAAEALGVETYLIGGFVRDKILGRDTRDADIVCAGDGIVVGRRFCSHRNVGAAGPRAHAVAG